MNQLHVHVFTTGFIFGFEALMGLVLNSFTVYFLQFGRRTGEKPDRILNAHLLNVITANLISSTVLPGIAFLTVNLNITCDILPIIAFRLIAETLKFTVVLLFIAVGMEMLVIIFSPFSLTKYRVWHKNVVTTFVWLLAFISSWDYFLTKLVKSSYTINSESSAENMSRLINETVPLPCSVVEADGLYPLLKYGVSLGVIITCYIIAAAKLHSRTKTSGHQGIFTDRNLQVNTNSHG